MLMWHCRTKHSTLQHHAKKSTFGPRALSKFPHDAKYLVRIVKNNNKNILFYFYPSSCFLSLTFFLYKSKFVICIFCVFYPFLSYKSLFLHAIIYLRCDFLLTIVYISFCWMLKCILYRSRALWKSRTRNVFEINKLINICWENLPTLLTDISLAVSPLNLYLARPLPSELGAVACMFLASSILVTIWKKELCWLIQLDIKSILKPKPLNA